MPLVELLPAPPATSTSVVRTLQIGKSWLPEQPGSGLDRVYHSLYRHLPEIGVQVHGVVAGSHRVDDTTEGQVTAFASDTAPLRKRLWAVRESVRQARTEPIDLVASHFALYTAPVLDLVADRPLVIHFHGPWAAESAVEGESRLSVWSKKALELAVYRRGTRFIVLSNAFRRILVDSYRVPEESVRVVPGGVDTKRFTTAVSESSARERLGWPTDRPILLSVRRLARRMGLENLIAAVDLMRSEVPEVLLLIAGTGPLQGELQKLIEDRGLRNSVRLLGYVPESDLPLAYRAATATVVPTLSLEGFGLITVESLASGTPVVVTPNGGLPDVVRDLSPDLIFKDTQPPALADRLSAVLRGACSLPSSEACREYAVANYSWPSIARQTRAVYEEVLNGK